MEERAKSQGSLFGSHPLRVVLLADPASGEQPALQLDQLREREKREREKRERERKKERDKRHETGYYKKMQPGSKNNKSVAYKLSKGDKDMALGNSGSLPKES